MTSRQPRLFDRLLFILLLTGPPKFRARDVTASLRGEMDAVVLVHICVWVLAALWVLYHLYPVVIRRGSLPRSWSTLVLAGSLIGVLCLSLPIAPGVLLTAFSLFQFAVMLGFAYVFSHVFGVRSYLHHMFAGYFLLTITVLVAWGVAPDLVATGGRVRGDAIAPAGAVAVFALTLCWSATPSLGRIAFIATSVAAGTLLVFSQTRTAFVALALFLLMGALLGRTLPVRRVLPYGIVLMLGIAVIDAMPTARDYVVREEASISDLSDRIPLWRHSITVMLRDSPVVGLGYYSASRVVGPQYNERLGNAHSAFVELLVGGGLVGGLLFIILFAVVLWNALNLVLAHPGRPQSVSLAGLTLLALTFSLTGSEGVHPGPIGFAFWSLTALLPVCRQSLNTSAAPRDRAVVSMRQSARRTTPTASGLHG